MDIDYWKQLTHATYFASAYLFWGNKGLGQQTFAESFSQWLLCERSIPNAQACGKCTSCKWLVAGTHPDRLILQPDSPTSLIKVDAVREIRAFSEQKCHGGQYRVIIISPAEAMNLAAANALLKILEEPFDKTIFLLVSYHFSSLLPTILSRCQKIYFPPLSPEAFKSHLEHQQCPPEFIDDLYSISYGAPDAFPTLKEKQQIIQLKKSVYTLMNSLRAKKINPMEAADSLKKEDFHVTLDLLLSYAHQWSIYKKEPKAHFFYDKLLETKKQVKNNINAVISLEALFFDVVESFK
jgi:DNA polymerase III subunit delta'